MKQKLINLFLGILSGDGDIAGRMASSHAEAISPYKPPLDQYVDRLNQEMCRGKYRKLSKKERLKLATTLAMEVSAIWGKYGH